MSAVNIWSYKRCETEIEVIGAHEQISVTPHYAERCSFTEQELNPLPCVFFLSPRAAVELEGCTCIHHPSAEISLSLGHQTFAILFLCQTRPGRSGWEGLLTLPSLIPVGKLHALPADNCMEMNRDPRFFVPISSTLRSPPGGAAQSFQQVLGCSSELLTRDDNNCRLLLRFRSRLYQANWCGCCCPNVVLNDSVPSTGRFVTGRSSSSKAEHWDSDSDC